MQQYHNITACPLNIQEYNKKYDIITTYCIEFILPLYLSYITPNMDIIKKLVRFTPEQMNEKIDNLINNLLILVKLLSMVIHQ